MFFYNYILFIIGFIFVVVFHMMCAACIIINTSFQREFKFSLIICTLCHLVLLPGIIRLKTFVQVIIRHVFSYIEYHSIPYQHTWLTEHLNNIIILLSLSTLNKKIHHSTTAFFFNYKHNVYRL